MNRIILTLRDNSQIEAPIQEDFSIEANTEFTSFADLAGSISSLVDLANVASTTGGTVSRAGLMLRSIIDAQHWSKTNPVKINLDMFFYTKADAQLDVVDKVNSLLALHLLRHDPKTNRILVPGINAKMIADMEKEIKGIEKERSIEKKEVLSKSAYDKILNVTSSFFSVIIPGVIYLENAFMFSVKPTYSKQVTEGGYPLWAQVNVEVCGIAPAFVEDFKRGSDFTYQGIERINGREIQAPGPGALPGI